MANSEVSRLKFNNTTYDIADELARQNIGVARSEIATEAARLDAVDTGLAGRITNLENSAGAVLVAKTKSAMSDTSKIYVYTGSESGMTRGNWYYHNGSAWVSGGAYNQNLDAIDATLTQSNKGADAKVTGDRLTAAETDISTLRGTIANEYTSQAYAVGDYCYHNGLLYRCNTEISVGETWTSGHWTAVDVMPELNNLKNDFTDRLSTTMKRILVTQTSAQSTYEKKASNLPVHSYAYISRSWFDDMDGTAGSEGHLITLGQAETVGKMQIYVSPYSGGNIYVRIKAYSSQTFGSWLPIFRLDTTLAVTGKAADAKATGDAIEVAKNFALKYHQVTASTAESDYGGLSANLPVRTFSFISKSWFDDMDNVLGSEGYIVSLGHSETVGKEQIYISPYGSSHIFMRAINSGTATPWLTPGKTASGAVYYAYGDSVTRGQIGQWSGDTLYSSRGYPYVIARQADMTLKQKAVGGQGLIKDWTAINSSIDSTDLSDAALITVGWAYNDYDEYSNLPMGSFSDTGTTTVIGYYYSIMAKLQAKAPMARLVLVTGYGYSDGTVSPQKKPTLTAQFDHSYPFSGGPHTVQEFYNELEKMCWNYGWGCVNQAKGCAFNRFNASTVIGDQIHPTDDGYALYGNSIANRVLAYYANIYI